MRPTLTGFEYQQQLREIQQNLRTNNNFGDIIPLEQPAFLLPAIITKLPC